MRCFLVLIVWFILYGAGAGALASEVPQKDRANSFKILATIDMESLKSDFFKYDGRFFVVTRVTNDSAFDQSIVVWTNYGWSWVSNNPDIEPGIEALKNYPKEIVLKPGQSYEGKIEMSSSAKKLPVNFQLGFMARVDLPLSTRQYPARYGHIYWSDVLTLL